MAHHHSADLGKLGRQSLRRPLSAAEAKFAEALEQIFASGCDDFSQVAARLGELGVQRPSGDAGPWNLEALESELRLVNASLDDAYTRKRTNAR